MKHSAVRLCGALHASVVGLLLLASVSALAVPRYIADVLEAYNLDGGVVNGAAIRFLSGQKFAQLVPASKQEVCRMLLDYYVEATPGVSSVQLVDAATMAVVSCE